MKSAHLIAVVVLNILTLLLDVLLLIEGVLVPFPFAVYAFDVLWLLGTLCPLSFDDCPYFGFVIPHFDGVTNRLYPWLEVGIGEDTYLAIEFDRDFTTALDVIFPFD